jgi:hypothetical protein
MTKIPKSKGKQLCKRIVAYEYIEYSDMNNYNVKEVLKV